MLHAPPDLRRCLRDARLYMVLTRRLCRLNPADVVRAAVRGGVDVIQIREPEASTVDLLAWAREVRALTAADGVPLIINDRVDLVSDVGADGAHVGQDDLPPRRARDLLGDGPLLGLSTHDAGQMVAAHREPVDCVGLGPAFDTATKGLRGLGIETIAAIHGLATLPAFIIGGVSLANITLLRGRGLQRVAVSGALCGSADPAEMARSLRAALT